MTHESLSTAGWATMILSIGGVSVLLAWCIWKVLSTPARDHDLAHVEPLDEDSAESR